MDNRKSDVDILEELFPEVLSTEFIETEVENNSSESDSDIDEDPSCSEILPNILYLGDETTASDLKKLKKFKINVIINLAAELKNKFIELGLFQYHSFPCFDSNEENISDFFEKMFKVIDESINKKQCVFVHCVAGVSRSGSCVIAYFMKKKQWTFDEAYEFVKDRRWCVCPNSGFMKQLKKYEEKCIPIDDENDNKKSTEKK